MGASVHAIFCFASEEICRLNKPHVAGCVVKIPVATATFQPPDESEYLFLPNNYAQKQPKDQSAVLFSHPVAVEELDGTEDVKLACHQELDGQLPGQR